MLCSDFLILLLYSLRLYFLYTLFTFVFENTNCCFGVVGEGGSLLTLFFSAEKHNHHQQNKHPAMAPPVRTISDCSLVALLQSC